MKCKKVRYHDHEQAVSAIKTIKNAPNDGDKPIRVCHCDECNGWHLTKKPAVTERQQSTTLKFYDAWRALCQL